MVFNQKHPFLKSIT